MKKSNFTIDGAIEKLKKESHQAFTVLMRNGSMSIEYFEPENPDTQQPHKQDEIYVIAEGASQFYRNGEVLQCGKGDILFVPAGMEHRFINFSANFATWVIFYGPEGGESPQ